MPDRKKIVVGVDASAGAEAALRWAVTEAVARNQLLRLLAIYDPETPPARDSTMQEPTRHQPSGRPAAERLIDALIATAQRQNRRVAVEGAAIEGDAGQVLVAESQHAELVVVGSRELGPVTSYLLGSVGQTVTARSFCPAVVVRGRDVFGPAEIVVGVAGNATDRPVLQAAFAEAQLHHARLNVVHAWQPPMWPAGSYRRDAHGRPRDAVIHQVNAAVDALQREYAEVRSAVSVIDGQPGEVLNDVSAGRHLLVVGASHGRPLRANLRGSVSLALLHHAACPVAVVPRPVQSADR